MAIRKCIADGDTITYFLTDEAHCHAFQQWIEAAYDPLTPFVTYAYDDAPSSERACHDEHLEEAHRQLDRADLTPEAVCTAIAHVLAYLKERR